MALKGIIVNGVETKLDYNYLENLPPQTLPTVTSSDEGKVLVVNSSGVWTATAIESAEGASF